MTLVLLFIVIRRRRALDIVAIVRQLSISLSHTVLRKVRPAGSSAVAAASVTATSSGATVGSELRVQSPRVDRLAVRVVHYDRQQH
ncbi:hypothetical protein BC827DRAFT_1200819 [Russula dissimulans]|nr:hypothetical protein BC827DRAFT_1200819 [Russula dissimulans]